MNERRGLEHSEKKKLLPTRWAFFFTTKFNEEKWRLAYTKKFLRLSRNTTRGEINFVLGPKLFRPREGFVARKWRKFRWLAHQTLTECLQI